MSKHTDICIKDVINEVHSGDKSQLKAIFAEGKRLIVEAPAGYGKTRTMVSKIAYIIATGRLPKPKKILALTFSVNAAYKIKKDVSEQLPILFETSNINPTKINEKVFISNYHGLCRHILKLYGYLIHEKLNDIEVLKSIDDSSIEALTNLDVGLIYDDAKQISDFCDAVKQVNGQYLSENMATYLKMIRMYFLPNGYITYNSIILFVLELFNKNAELRQFYRKYFPIIIVDEFQDTNLISYAILQSLIGEKNSAIFIGDPLQRIYGFIGAIPDLLEKAKKKFGMRKIRLTENHRFKSNPRMMLLDRNIRLNADNPADPNVKDNAEINLNIFADQDEEAQWVSEKSQEIICEDPSATIAVLTRGRNANIANIISKFDSDEIEYFYGLFTDEDTDYLNFHRECISIFFSHFKDNNRVTKISLKRFYNKINRQYKDKLTPAIQSLLDLLKIFLNRINTCYAFLTNEDKITYILDTLENKALKQHMEYVDKNITFSTIHGAKGLEWDYIIMPDMEQYVFPNYFGLCGKCNFQHNSINEGCCEIIYNKNIEREFLEELSVFYVSVTRARRDVWFSSSQKRIHFTGDDRTTYVSCLLSLPGIVCK